MIRVHELHIHPARAMRGAVRVPGDKSISHRYVLLGGLARGTTRATHLAPGADVGSSIACMRALGIDVHQDGLHAVTIRGRGRRGLQAPTSSLDAGNSGTTMRLLSGIVAAHPFHSRLVGDDSLSRRPMRRVIDPLTAMGARIASSDGRAPLDIQGADLSGITWATPVPSAQIKSCVLLAGLHASGRTTVTETVATRDHTERAFKAFGIVATTEGLSCSVEGGQEAVAPQESLTVPGDPSSAGVWAAAAAALPGSSIRLDDVCLNPQRLGFIRALERLGASIQVQSSREIAGEPVGLIQVSHGQHTPAIITPAEVPSLIDELPVLAARAALGAHLRVTGAGELRVKESDRISALVAGFRALGVDAEELPDGFEINGSRQPTGGTADAAGDHRLVMAFALVGLGASGPTTVTGADAVAISYPSFEQDLAQLRQ
jgi:3-phosphoshikimate 1-carboxyvinyltransferase